MMENDGIITTMSKLLDNYSQILEETKKEWESAKALFDNHIENVPFDERVSEMDADKTWAVVYTYHDHDEEFFVGVMPVNAPDMLEALEKASDPLSKVMWEKRWSDYIVIGAMLIREVH